MLLPALLILYSAATNYCAVYHYLHINRQLSQNNYYLSHAEVTPDRHPPANPNLLVHKKKRPAYFVLAGEVTKVMPEA